MYELKKFGNVVTGKSVRTGPSSYEKRIYQAAVSQRFRNTDLKRWHPKCAPRIGCDPPPFPTAFVDTFV